MLIPIKQLLHGTVMLLCFAYTTAYAQEAVLSSGGDASSAAGSVASSVGQVVYTTYVGTNGSVAQGVQQPYEISVATGIEETSIQLHVVAFPNPTTNNLQLQIDVYDNTTSYQLYNNNGQLLETKAIEANTTLLVMGQYASAIYYVKVIRNNKEVKVFKIIKN